MNKTNNIKNKNIINNYKSHLRFFLIMLLMLAMAAITACSGGNGDKNIETGNRSEVVSSETGSNDDLVYIPEFTKLVLEPELAEGEEAGQCTAYFAKEGRTYAVISTWQKSVGGELVLITDLVTGEQQVKRTEKTGYMYFNSVNGFAVYSMADSMVYMYDDDWENTGNIDLSGVAGSAGTGSEQAVVKSVVSDDEGNTAVIYGRAVLLFDREGELVKSISLPDKVSEARELITTQGGNWYLVCSLRSGVSFTVEGAVCSLDMNSGEFGAGLEVPYDISNNSAIYSSMNSIEAEGFYIHGKDYIYRYDENTKMFNKLFCPGDYGINVSFDTSFSVGRDGCFYIANRADMGLSMECELATVTGVPVSQVKERTQLVLGALSMSSSIYQPILDFNKYNQDYYVKVKNYQEGAADYDAARQSFYNDLLKGEGADIFYVIEGDEGIDLASLGDKGVVADLYEFIDNDEKVSSEDFIPNLLTQMEQSDGKLYALYFEPQLTFLVGKASLFDDCEEWSYTELLNIMSAYPEALPVANLGREWEMQRFMWYSMGAFYDRESGECHFDTDEFKAMLQIVSMVPEQIDYELSAGTQGEQSISGMLDRDEVLIYDQYGGSITWNGRLYFGDSEIKYLGIPSSGGVAEVQFFFGLAINAQSANKQAAWEFIRSLLDEDFQMSGMFPIMNSYVDAKLKKLLEGQDRDDEFEQLRERTHYLLDNCVGRRDYDSDIYTIIDEEAGGYFAGDRGLDETAATIQNRIQLYIEEKR